MIRVMEGTELIGSYKDVGSISDGNHTFNELYDHRCLLMLMVMDSHPSEAWFSLKHDDGESWDGWFICGLDLPTGMITYHLPLRMLQLARDTGAKELKRGEPWDGHTPSDVVNRMTEYLKMEIN